MAKGATRAADVVRRSRIVSRLTHGRPGQGRKTRFVDRRKQGDRLACRRGVRQHAEEP